jgi:hypothetical protein
MSEGGIKSFYRGYIKMLLFIKIELTLHWWDKLSTQQQDLEYSLVSAIILDTTSMVVRTWPLFKRFTHPS